MESVSQFSRFPSPSLFAACSSCGAVVRSASHRVPCPSCSGGVLLRLPARLSPPAWGVA